MSSSALLLLATVTIVAADVSSLYPRIGSHQNSVDFDPNPQYTYSYSVNDAHTGDNHAQEETRNGDNVHGSYSLIEADGTLRTVKYSADAVNGFTAIVEHSGSPAKSFGLPATRVASYAPVAAVPAAPASYITPKVTISPQPYAYRSAGGASVHTSFSAPHASYQY